VQAATPGSVEELRFEFEAPVPANRGALVARRLALAEQDGQRKRVLGDRMGFEN